MSKTIGQYLATTPSITPLIGSYFTHDIPPSFEGAINVSEIISSKDFQDILKEFIVDMYDDYKIRKGLRRDDIGAETIRIKSVCDEVYTTHEYTYNTLYNTMYFKYNPIENYDMKEHENIENTGSDTTQHVIGSHTDSTAYGETNARDIYGDQSSTDVFGKRSTTSDATKDVAPFETQSYQHVDKTHDSNVQDSVTDQHNQSSHTDQHIVNSRSDSTTYGGKTDTDTLDHGHNIERDLTRSGNIGVTTSQQMLLSQRDVSKLNFARVVANDLVHALCICYEGVNLF